MTKWFDKNHFGGSESYCDLCDDTLTDIFLQVVPAASVPTSTSAPVDSVNGAEEPMKAAMPVTIHADNQDFTQNSTGPTSC